MFKVGGRLSFGKGLTSELHARLYGERGSGNNSRPCTTWSKTGSTGAWLPCASMPAESGER